MQMEAPAPPQAEEIESSLEKDQDVNSPIERRDEVDADAGDHKDGTEEGSAKDSEGEDEEDDEEEGSANEDDEDDEDDNGEEASVLEGAASDDKSGKKIKRKRVAKGKGGKRKRSKQRMHGYRFFSDYAEEGDDDEGDDDEREATDIVLGKDELAANEAVDRRHARQREFLEKSPEEIAAEYEERDRLEEKMKQSYKDFESRSGAKSIPVAQQSLLPKVTDPKIFKIKCKPGMEQVAIRSIMLKALDMRQKDGFLKVKTAFCGDIKGYIYVEAISEAFAKEVVSGLKMLYFMSFAQVPIPDMPSVLAVTVKKKPLVVGQWVRIKRGPLKGDLARIVQLFEGGGKAFIQAIPRPDYSLSEGKKSSLASSNKVRPPQRLFDAEQAKAMSGGNVFRRYHPDVANEAFDLWEGDYYQDGFLYKMVICATYIAEQHVSPKIEELQLFLNSIKAATLGADPLDEPMDAQEEAPRILPKTLNQELSAQIQSLEDEGSDVISFVVGDYVLVVGGELQNLVAKVSAINDMRRTARIVAVSSTVPGEFEIEWDLLVKHVYVGAHVKVMKGKYMGQTGRVVSVMLVDGSQTAAILTDGLNNEIQCNVSFLQMTSEVATGLGSLMGYELYDLVQLNENESAVVINVMVERLRVLNHLENVKDVAPQEVRSKQNLFSSRSKSYDAQQNVISCGDTMNVISGPHAKLSGSIKHIMKGTLWLHSDSYLKNSGVFVVKARNCVVAGGKGAAAGLMAMRAPGGANKGGSNYSTPSSQATPSARMGRDPLMSKMVRIKKGAYKGLVAQVVDVTATHYSVELLAKLKKVVVAKEDVLPVESKPSETRFGRYGDNMVAPDTPYLTSHTPAHMAGAETPNYLGGETPMWSGNMTPYGADEMSDMVPDAPPSRTTTPRLSDVGDLTPASSHYTPGSATPAGGDMVDFEVGFVVVMKKGEMTGRLAVLTGNPDELGYCMCKLRDGQGRLNREEVQVSVTDIALAEPQKNSSVVVLTGKHHSRHGTVKAAAGKDAQVAFSASEVVFLKRSTLAWLHE